MVPDSEIPGGFAPTRWSLVLRARGDGEPARVALGELCAAYWYPIYGWARRTGLDAADAEDAVQGFFEAVLSRDLFSRADAERGRLRTFLLTVFKRHLQDHQDRHRAEKRGGGRVISFDAVEAEQWFLEESASVETPDHFFDRQWAVTLLERALGRVEEAYAQRGKSSEFEALRPFLTASGSQAEYEAGGQPIGLGAGAFKVALHRLRNRFGEAVRKEVQDTSEVEADVEEEVTYLLRVLE